LIEYLSEIDDLTNTIYLDKNNHWNWNRSCVWAI